MRKHEVRKEAKGASTKRLVATGKKVNGTWEVRTFLRLASADRHEPFWETVSHGRRSARPQ